ncbi:unnamed protein product, partial [Candidula unifasciata]
MSSNTPAAPRLPDLNRFLQHDPPGDATMATIQPSSDSEWQLYQVLQRANLLNYFETFISQGGDDVQQLCEAGEEEFLEIMALVGMASKPLHVRRLQKSLQEWLSNPAAFEVIKKYPAHGVNNGSQSSLNMTTGHPADRPHDDDNPCPAQPSPGLALSHCRSQQHIIVMPDPRLSEHHLAAIATAAACLAQDLPPLEPKSMPKKPICQDILSVMQMSTDDPHRMSALRKYAAIYGRFDSRRRNDKPMNMHEISVNEAAAQLCGHCPALLTRREELFPLARQVVRESGYQYSKGHSSSIRSALRVLLESNDHQQMRKLTAEMDILNDRQTAMIKQRQKIKYRILLEIIQTNFTK